MSFLFKKVAAQDAGNEEILMKSLIDLFNEAKEKGDAKLLDFVKRSWNAAKVKPNYKAMSNNPAYRKLDKIASDEVANDSAADAAPKFKVGDKVKHTQYGTIGKVFEIDPAGNVGVQWNNGQAYYGKTAKPLSLIIAADSSRWTDLDDGIKTIENKARALIADAKNTRSKYAEILARSEIAKNNAPVKKTFEDDIARCDKLINALKAI